MPVPSPARCQAQEPPILQVHDELVLGVLGSRGGASLVKREMEGVYSLAVPLVVGVSYGRNWRDVTAYEAKSKYA